LFIPRSIGQRFAIAIGTGAGLILIVLAVANYFSGRELLLEQTSGEALKEVRAEMRSMDDLIDRMAVLPAVIGSTEIMDGKRGGVSAPWLASLLEHCPMRAAYGLYMALEDKDWRTPEADIWVDRKSWPHAARLKYDFHDPSQDWYRGAHEDGKVHVTQPYFDEGGSDIDMVSITQPVYDHHGTFIGVAGVDVALDEMRKIVREMHIRNVGTDSSLSGTSGKVTSVSSTSETVPKNLRESAYLVSPTGAIIVSPEESQEKAASKESEKTTQKTLEDLAQGLVTSLPGIQQILASPSGWLRLNDGSDKVIYWAEGRTTGWKLVLEVPYKLIVAPARRLAEQSAIIGGVGLFLLLSVVFFVARKVSGPIVELQSVAANLEKGTYEESKGVLERIERRQDELGRFARSFSAMAHEIRLREERLSEWNANLEQTVKDRTAALALAMGELEKANTAMASELAEAATYSRAVLPRKLDKPIPTDWIFITSSQLGGDSFGYHWIDEDHLALYLLDVCGHGVGAALLSISVANVLRTESLAGTDFKEPTEVLSKLNSAFPMENHNEMYFTAWYGVYSCAAGELRFACGGHPPAVLLEPNGKSQHLTAKGTIVGAFPNVTYETASTSVPAGSRLYLFSDGTYEIDRPNASMMTYEEFSQLLTSPDRGAGLDSVLAEVRRQQGSDAFADDFSLVEFRFPESTGISSSRITLRNNLEELTRLLSFTQEFFLRNNIAAKHQADIDLILEEMVTNILKYGGLPKDAEACSIELALKDSHIEIRISDNGTPFDPLHLPEVNTALLIEERPIGGLGIHFVKKLTSSQSYEYRDGKNILTLTKELGA